MIRRVLELVILLGVISAAVLAAVAWQLRVTPPPREPAYPLVGHGFQVDAEFTPGESYWTWWEICIGGDGSVTRRSQSTRNHPCQAETMPRLSPEQVQKLLQVVEHQDFLNLRADPVTPDRLTGSDRLALTVSLAGRSRAIAVMAPWAREDDWAHRFVQVWAEVERLVPSPNPGDNPDYWLNLKPL